MFAAGVSGIKSYGATALVLVIIAFLAAVLIERRLFAPRPPGPALAAETALPDLRRIVLDPCTGAEKTVVASHAAPEMAKAD